uniref:Uncharacterized protein n=1 Tax=Schistocephalus solidus TaxID=70667 RepID=A0A0X3PS80_SCHSO
MRITSPLDGSTLRKPILLATSIGNTFDNSNSSCCSCRRNKYDHIAVGSEFWRVSCRNSCPYHNHPLGRGWILFVPLFFATGDPSTGYIILTNSRLESPQLMELSPPIVFNESLPKNAYFEYFPWFFFLILY